MDIVLNKNDIESLIKAAYSGVENIKFNVKNIKVTLEVNINKFTPFKKTNIPMESSEMTKTPKDDLSDDEKQMLEASQGVMASGGNPNRRNLINVG